jgi:hypothetical protein
MNEDQTRALAMLGHIISIETLGLLVTKEVISLQELRETLDRVLLNIEQHSALASPENENATALARQMCAALLARLEVRESAPRRQTPPRNQ